MQPPPVGLLRSVPLEQSPDREIGSVRSGATSYNQPMSSFDLNGVATISQMLQNTTSFNQDLSAWDLSTVQDMSFLLSGATIFNNGGSALIDNWSTSSCTNMSSVFYLHKPNREAAFLKGLLREFVGVLVTDFYAGYGYSNRNAICACSCTRFVCLANN